MQVSMNVFDKYILLVLFLILQVSLKDLSLSSHARQKLIALSGQRYDRITDEIKLIGEKCPTKEQNRCIY